MTIKKYSVGRWIVRDDQGPHAPSLELLTERVIGAAAYVITLRDERDAADLAAALEQYLADRRQA